MAIFAVCRALVRQGCARTRLSALLSQRAKTAGFTPIGLSEDHFYPIHRPIASLRAKGRVIKRRAEPCRLVFVSQIKVNKNILMFLQTSRRHA